MYLLRSWGDNIGYTEAYWKAVIIISTILHCEESMMVGPCLDNYSVGFSSV